MKIFVLGSTGMTGSYVSSYFEKRRYKVIRATRDDIDAENITNTELSIWFKLHGDISISDLVINCIGLITQKMTDKDAVKAIKINSVFPYLLSSICSEKYAELIHISSDCVFSGVRGGYKESDTPDPSDLYGQTKVAGEPQNCSVIRTSLIGEAVFKGSLLEWVRSNKEIRGYTNHFWNGITCLQLAKCIEEIMVNNLFWDGVRHYFSESVTKAQLVRYIVEVYNTGSHVENFNAEKSINRTLSSDYNLFKEPPTILRQIREQKEWLLK
jgi:dTDP-4-dehydrorhamnose reductase